LVQDGHDVDAVIDALRAVYDDRDAYGRLAREHTRMVDHRRSVAAFRSGLEALLDDR
jgi:hypothetical protein